MIFREYLATFKKTVAMHEVFLCRLANHPVFRADTNFRVFLEYEHDVKSRCLLYIIICLLIYPIFAAVGTRQEQERKIRNIPTVLFQDNG